MGAERIFDDADMIRKILAKDDTAKVQHDPAKDSTLVEIYDKQGGDKPMLFTSESLKQYVHEETKAGKAVSKQVKDAADGVTTSQRTNLEELWANAEQEKYNAQAMNALSKATPGVQWNPEITRRGITSEAGLNEKDANRIVSALKEHAGMKLVYPVKTEKGDYFINIQSDINIDSIMKMKDPKVQEALQNDLKGIEMERKISSLSPDELRNISTKVASTTLSANIPAGNEADRVSRQSVGITADTSAAKTI